MHQSTPYCTSVCRTRRSVLTDRHALDGLSGSDTGSDLPFPLTSGVRDAYLVQQANIYVTQVSCPLRE